MKLFGQYLLENGLVTPDALLKALIRQLESMPSVAAMVHELKLLPVDDQLKILEQQWRSDTEYRRACMDLGLWSENLTNALRDGTASRRIPLGELLVKDGALSLDDLAKSLEAFLRTERREPAPSAPAASSELSPNADALAIYCEFFDEAMRDRLLAAATTTNLADLKLLMRALTLASHAAGLTASRLIFEKAAAQLTGNAGASAVPAAVAAAWELRGRLAASTRMAA